YATPGDAQYADLADCCSGWCGRGAVTVHDGEGGYCRRAFDSCAAGMGATAGDYSRGVCITSWFVACGAGVGGFSGVALWRAGGGLGVAFMPAQALNQILSAASSNGLAQSGVWLSSSAVSGQHN